MVLSYSERPIIIYSVVDITNPEDRRKALEMNKRLVEFCDELWVFGDEITEEMEEEIEHFRRIKGEDKVRILNRKLSFGI